MKKIMSIKICGDEYMTKSYGHPKCCGQEMLIAGNWLHCLRCNNKFIRVNDIRSTAHELLAEYCGSYLPMKKDFMEIMHEIWREGHYEDYESKKIPKEWWY